ncbi:DNA-binding MarR family transcriptional regulator [Microbacterium endophyticum]|uniref:DNA-binding MarR family transcriptional regulator n=1 Tax=Microbacterium endophyticum TaxID=1526412 RepID=A0A7W4V302_9MICO|nr:MarR family transcriptional regulator [Microbacterium endophyticum]MBB2975900.1 DNA-binding MarR family transcriptional regulator [Microbacterium endophyticum]NIK36383.1 DNA-binding MarR family transcriptional regulator [Microbacterium endophyticum]
MNAVDKMVCFSLYSASRATTQAYRSLLKPWDLTYPQYLVLVSLWSEGPLSVGALGEALDLDSGTLSPLLRRLDSAGLVTRTREAPDERIVTVSLTDRGRELRSEMRELPSQALACMNLTPAAATALLEALQSYSKSMRQPHSLPIS